MFNRILGEIKDSGFFKKVKFQITRKHCVSDIGFLPIFRSEE
jgi:hypothetical protein